MADGLLCIGCGDYAEHLHADGLCWACTSVAEYAPIPARSNSSASGAGGPCSNTGQNAETLPRRRGVTTKPRANIPRAKRTGQGGALVDYLSLTIPGASDLLRELGEQDFAQKVVNAIFGRAPLLATEFTGRGFQGYENSARVIGPGGEDVGRIGIGGNADTLHVSISGAGCAVVEDWQRVQTGCLTLAARITRCDVAWDDYEGAHFDPRSLNAQVLSGALRIRTQGPGQPPKTRFLDDHGHGTGCTLYAGRKGHKELCIYQKGKEQGDPSSRWVRVEVRFWSKRQDIPVSILTEPLAYLRAAYNVCEAIPADVCDRIKTQRAKAEATVTAWGRWMQRQFGASVRVLHRALGDGMAGFLIESIAAAASGRPQRFRGMTDDALTEAIRTRLGHVGSRDPVGALA